MQHNLWSAATLRRFESGMMAQILSLIPGDENFTAKPGRQFNAFKTYKSSCDASESGSALTDFVLLMLDNIINPAISG